MARIAPWLTKCNSAERNPQLRQKKKEEAFPISDISVVLMKEWKDTASCNIPPVLAQKILVMHWGQWDQLGLWHDHGLLYSGLAGAELCVCVERWGIWGNWGLGFTCAFMYRLQHFTLQLLCCQDVVPVRTSKPSVNLPLWWRQVVHKTQGTMW